MAPATAGAVVIPATTLPAGSCSSFALEIGLVGSSSANSKVTIVGG